MPFMIAGTSIALIETIRIMVIMIRITNLRVNRNKTYLIITAI